jgi:hypothetical protein
MFKRILNAVRSGAFYGTAPSTSARGLVAAGSSNADALQLSADADFNVVGTAAASTGVRLPTPGGVGDAVLVYNRGANAVLVYPQAGGAVNALTATTGGFSVAAGGRAVFTCWDGTNWCAVLSA